MMLKTEGADISEEIIDGFFCSEVNRSDECAGRKPGRYITIDIGRIWLAGHCDFRNAVDLVASKLRELIPSDSLDEQLALIAGLGNAGITADSIGPRALSKVLVTRHFKKDMGFARVAGIVPGVLAQTGMETADTILAVSREIRPTVVILIDALATHSISRLATTIQMSNTGISPGSGVDNHRRAIDAELLGVPVVSIGVPMVVDAATLSHSVLSETCERLGIELDERLTRDVLNTTLEENGGNFFVTPKESDLVVSEVSKLIGYAINRCFHDISFEEMIRVLG